MNRKRVGRHIGGGPEPDDERERRERADLLKDALARWASGVSIFAVRAQGRVHALTVSAFVPVSVEPPLVLAALGPNAAALPYLEEGTTFAISLLTAAQRGLASRFADSFPVGPAPFPETGPPVVEDALATLVCEVTEILPRGDHTLVIGAVRDARAGLASPALAYYRRDYHSLG
jgi:flavin reductase (NADH)